MFSHEIVINSPREYYSLGEGNMCLSIGALRVLPMVPKRYHWQDSWIFIVLVLWNNSSWIDMYLNISWFWTNQPLLFLPKKAQCCMLSEEATNTNFIVFGFTRSRHESTIYHTRGKHTNYTTNAVLGDIDGYESFCLLDPNISQFLFPIFTKNYVQYQILMCKLPSRLYDKIWWFQFPYCQLPILEY